MAREDLVKYQFTSEQSRTAAAINGSKGGIACGKARRERALVRTYIREWLTDSGMKGQDGETIPGAEVLAKRILKGCRDGNTKMIELALALDDQKPAEKIQVAEIDPAVASAVESMVYDTE